MEIALYQIDMERDTNRIAFANLEFLEKYQGSLEISSALYDKVYEGDVDCSGLEDVFRLFNLELECYHFSRVRKRTKSMIDMIE